MVTGNTPHFDYLSVTVIGVLQAEREGLLKTELYQLFYYKFKLLL